MPPSAPTSVRDRTGEFHMLCERVQKHLGTSSAANGGVSASHKPSNDKNPSSIAARAEFNRRAAEIGHGIHKVALKLEKLAQLTKRTSMFDDPTAEVDELTGLIKHDIQHLHNSIAELQRLTGRAKEDNQQSQAHSNTVVNTLRLKLKDSTQKFNETLTVREENLKRHKERQQLFSITDADEGSPLLRGSQQQQQHGLPFGDSGGGSSSSAVVPSFMQSQQQMSILAAQDTYVNSRSENIINIKDTILEMGQMMQQLATLVAEQGQMAERIDANMDDSLTNVTQAQAQLLKYLDSISSNRWLILKVFAVLLVFTVIFIMFIA